MQIEAIAKKAAEYLHRAYRNTDDSLSARQRLAVWFRANGNVRLYEPHRYVKIDQTGDTSEFDIREGNMTLSMANSASV